jgi:M6 family metalloprotease-like protein
MPMPFYGKEFSFTQPDGKKIKVRGWGNQHYAVFEDLKGFSIIKDPKTGFYQYAKLSKDKKKFEPSGAVVGREDPKNKGLAMHLRIPKEEAKRQARSAAFRQGKKKSRWEQRREEAQARRRAAPRKGAVAPAPPGEQRTGSYTGLCILIQFPDVAGTITQAEVDDFCNLQGYNQNGNNGSVYDYYNDVSGGKFLYTNIVTAYYTAQNPRAYYTDPAIQFGTRARELITEALNDLIANGFNFTPLSADNTNHIYAVNAFYAGTCVNNWGQGLWPHSWYLDPQVNCGNNRIAMDYQITDMGNALSIATFCHENGHMVCDFPDLYDYGYESFGAGNYCLMGFGGSDAGNPTQVGAYLKFKAGWADNATALVAGNYVVDGTINDFLTYSKSPTEYFIIENRIQNDRDAALPKSGLAIWHIDENGSNDNEQMTAGSHYECALEQADGLFNLEHDNANNGNPGDIGDLYGAPSQTTFGAATMPASSWWDGTASGLEITNISVPGQTMSLTVGGGAAGCDLFLRDNLQDDGTEPLANGGISCSPDIIVFNQQLADPVGELGTAAAMQNDTLGNPVESGQDNYLYLRVTNRGTQPGSGTARVFWAPASALPTPASWTEITDPLNPAVIPSINPQGVGIVGPVTWDSADIPAIGHYCFIGLIDAAGDPAPDPATIQTINDYYTYIRENNNATWKNFNLTSPLLHS